MPIRDEALRKVSGLYYHAFVPITITNPANDKFIHTYGMLDTGASCCNIPAAMARRLGHNVEKGKENITLGAGGDTVGYLHTAKIEMMHPTTFKCFHTISACLIDCPVGLPHVLLGVSAFMADYKLIMDYPKGKFSLMKEG